MRVYHKSGRLLEHSLESGLFGERLVLLRAIYVLSSWKACYYLPAPPGRCSLAFSQDKVDLVVAVPLCLVPSSYFRSCSSQQPG